MKHTLSFLLFFILSFGITAQNPTENYIKRTVYTAPSTQGITENDTLVSITYFDGLGRPKQQVSVRGGFDRLSHNLLPWKRNWTVGSGSAPFFNQNGQESDNERIMGDNPFGRSALLWRCGNDPNSNADGGWNTDYFPVDNTIAYRYTVWVKRTGSMDGKTYHGTQNVNTLADTPHANPYFWADDPPQLDQWYLLVGIVHPYDYIGGDSGLSGVYDMQGNKVLDGVEFKWDATTSTSRFRSYLYYGTDTNVRQYFYNPILQKLDGSEASLEDILYERGAPDIVTPIVYDAFGRQTKEYLPYPATTQNGNIHLDPLAEIEAHYNIPKYGNTTNPYSEKILEASPLGRVMEQGAPGTPWMADPTSDTDHTIKFTYGTNTTDEVRLYRVTTTGNSYAPPLSTFNAILEEDGFYLPGRLYKTITKDENWQPGDEELHTTEEFKDFQGRVVLKRTYNTPPLGEPQGAVAHDTYYVYDDYGNLSFVIPPKVDTSDGVSPEELSALCYQYVYDHRNRLVEKKLPGKGWESIVYNKGNRPVFTQDQKLLTQGKWLFTKYDKFGRVLYTGLYASPDSREALQTTLEGHSPIYDHKTDTPTLIGGKQVYYINDAFPNTDLELLSINYYDTYTFDLDGAIEEDAYGVTPTTKTKTLTTGTKVRVLGTDHWITTVSWYDEKARPIYSYTHNPYLNTIDKVKHKVNFIGNILETATEHTKDGQAPITTIEKFTYDRMGRLLTHTHQITGQGEETLAENSYDALGQLIQKKIGNNTASPLQTVDYSYNIRGWLTGINDVSNLQNDLFGFQLHYDDPTGGTALYNGNISQTRWRTNNTDSSLKNYTYAYDPLNRITQAIDNTGNYNLNSISYDKNGNILSLNRQGHLNEITNDFGVMDELTYSYDSGNKLLKVEDTADDTFGFKDDAVNTPDTTPDYTYDANGNMLSDTNKNITGISYNHLNLPVEITFNADPNQKINYFYSADGIKQQKVVTDSGVTTTTAYTGGTVYENGSLKFIHQAEGYIEPDGAGGYDYVYQYKDHLGNIRLSYSDADDNGVIHGASTQLFFDDFEAASGWDGSGAGWGQSITSFDDTVTFDGDYSGRVYAAMGTSVAVHSNEWVAIDNTSDTDYIYTAWAYSESPIIRLGLGMKEDGEAGYLTLFDDILIIDELNKWVYVEKRVTVPAHITSLNVRIECAAWENRVGNVWFDNVSIRRVNEPVDVEIVEEKHYYPFGLVHWGYNSQVQGTYHPYGFNGKEEQTELDLNWLDFGARNYDATLGRWMNLDPLAEDYYEWSPYNFVYNSPLKFIDPTGMGPEWIDNGDGTYTAEVGDSAASLYNQHLKDKGYTFEEVDAMVQEQHGENYTEGGVEKSNIDKDDVVKVQGEMDVIAFDKAQAEAKETQTQEANNQEQAKIDKLENEIDSISHEITKSHERMGHYNAMADFDRKYLKSEREGVGTSAAYALSAARNETDSVRNVAKRKVLINKRDSIKKRISNN